MKFIKLAIRLIAVHLGLATSVAVALDLGPVRVGGYDTSGEAWGEAVSGNVNGTNATPSGTSWATASGNRNAINPPLPL